MSAQPNTNRRKLRPWEAVALSIGFMAPLLAMSLNGIGVAGLVGKAVPLTFVLAFLGVATVAYAFVRLTSRFNHAGSVYAIAGLTLGPRAGFFSGFALLGTYLFFAVCTLGACGVFFGQWMNELEMSADAVPWFSVALAAAGLCLLINLRESQLAARILLVIGGVGIAAMLVLSFVILGRVGSGQSPAGQSLDFSVFTFDGTSPDVVLTATVFAFLSWAGFESCASLGEETDNPKRAIPLALVGAVVLCGVVYIFVIFAQTIGFGTDQDGVAAFSGSESSLTQLGTLYVGKGFSLVLAFTAFFVAFASALSSIAAASRLVFALARDGFGPPSLGRVNLATGIPSAAVVTVTALTAALAGGAFLAGTSAFDTYYWFATIAVLCMLVAYGMTSVGAIRFAFTKNSGIRKWELALPALGIIYLGFVFFIQSTGQTEPYTYFPWIAGAWCLLGLAIVVIAPGLANRIGARLSAPTGTPNLAEPAPDSRIHS